MVLPNPNNGSRTHPSQPDLHSFNNGDSFDDDTTATHRFSEGIDSNCSTPYVSAPSSPGRGGPSGYFFSAPASPMHYVLSSAPSSQAYSCDNTIPGSYEFEFSSRFSSNASVGPGSMSSADELFCNGQIKPMKLSSHLQRPQMLAPLIDLEVEEDEESRDDEKREETMMRGRDLRSRNRSLHRKTRSMSPMRNSPFLWPEDDVSAEINVAEEHILELVEKAEKHSETPSTETTPSVSASSSRSSSTGRNSKKWIFLKDLLYRSKSEGRANGKEKFWSSISFSPAKEKNTTTPSTASPSPPPSSSTETQKQKQSKHSKSSRKSSSGKPANGVSKRRGVPPSPHELHYTTNRAQAEEMKKKTYLPYRQGLLGCLGFSSKGYGALNGFTRTLNPVSSR